MAISVAAIGTYAWTAPEQYLRSKTTKAIDVYAFGVVLWELFTRRRPWEGMTGKQNALIITNSNRADEKYDGPCC